MPHHVGFADKVARNGSEAHRSNHVDIGFHHVLARFAVLLDCVLARHRGVDHDVVKDPLLYVDLDGGHMFASGEAIAFPWLGHHVADVDAGSIRLPKGLRDSGDQEVGDDAGVNASGTDADKIGIQDRLDGGSMGGAIGGVKVDATDLRS